MTSGHCHRCEPALRSGWPRSSIFTCVLPWLLRGLSCDGAWCPGSALPTGPCLGLQAAARLAGLLFPACLGWAVALGRKTLCPALSATARRVPAVPRHRSCAMGHSWVSPKASGSGGCRGWRLLGGGSGWEGSCLPPHPPSLPASCPPRGEQLSSAGPLHTALPWSS